MSKPTVTFVVSSIYSIGGTVRATVATANYLVAHDYPVNIISMYWKGKKPVFEIDGRIKLIPLVNQRGFSPCRKILSRYPGRLGFTRDSKHHNLYSDLLLIKKLRKLKTDYLVCSIIAYARAALLPHAHKRKVIAQEHRGVDRYSKENRQRLLRILRKVDIVHCVNNSDKKSYRKALPAKVEVVRIPNSTILQERECVGLRSKTIISTGRLAYPKNYHILISAFARFLPHFPDWKLKIYGNGVDKEKLQELITDLGLAESAFLIPAVPDIFPELEKAGMYVCSSRRESFCISMLEAMSMKMPCITFDCRGPRDYIKDGVNGILVKQGDVDGLVDAMLRVASSPDQFEAMGNAARETADLYSPEAVGKQWEELLLAHWP